MAQHFLNFPEIKNIKVRCHEKNLGATYEYIAAKIHRISLEIIRQAISNFLLVDEERDQFSITVREDNIPDTIIMKETGCIFPFPAQIDRSNPAFWLCLEIINEKGGIVELLRRQLRSEFAQRLIDLDEASPGEVFFTDETA